MMPVAGCIERQHVRRVGELVTGLSRLESEDLILQIVYWLDELAEDPATARQLGPRVPRALASAAQWIFKNLEREQTAAAAVPTRQDGAFRARVSPRRPAP